MILETLDSHKTRAGGEIVAAKVWTAYGPAYAVLFPRVAGAPDFCPATYCDDEAHARRLFAEKVAADKPAAT